MPPADLAMWTREVSSLIEFLEQLSDITLLNRLGFSKVLKKSEKLVPHLHMTAAFQGRVQSSHFSESTKPIELITWARTVGSRERAGRPLSGPPACPHSRACMRACGASRRCCRMRRA